MPTQQIVVSGGNLFALALKYLGDATQWNRIAELSGTGADPFLLTGVFTTLLIPSKDTTAGGGVYTPNNRPAINPPYLLNEDGAILLDANGNPLLRVV